MKRYLQNLALMVMVLAVLTACKAKPAPSQDITTESTTVQATENIELPEETALEETEPAQETKSTQPQTTESAVVETMEPAINEEQDLVITNEPEITWEKGENDTSDDILIG